MYGRTRVSSMCWFGAEMRSTTNRPMFSSLLASYTSLEENSTNLKPLLFWWWTTPWKNVLGLPNEFTIDMRYHLSLLLIDAEVVSNLLPLFERCRHLLFPPPTYHSQLWNYLHRWKHTGSTVRTNCVSLRFAHLGKCNMVTLGTTSTAKPK